MVSKLLLRKHWEQAATMQEAPKRKAAATKCWTVSRACELVCHQPRRTIGHGSRNHGTKQWSSSMENIGHRSSLDGCRPSWKTSVATHSLCSCITRQAACSMALRLCMCQGSESNGSRLQPQSRDRINRSRGLTPSVIASVDTVANPIADELL